MKADDLLKAQHHDVEKLFGEIEQSRQDSTKLAAFEELATMLVAQDAAERDIFYPACHERAGLDDVIREALLDQGRIEFALYEAEQARGQPSFDYCISVLHEAVRKHIKTDEKRLLPKVGRELQRQVLEDLGEKMEERFAEGLAADFREPLLEHLRQLVESGVTWRGKSTS